MFEPSCTRLHRCQCRIRLYTGAGLAIRKRRDADHVSCRQAPRAAQQRSFVNRRRDLLRPRARFCWHCRHLRRCLKLSTKPAGGVLHKDLSSALGQDLTAADAQSDRGSFNMFRLSARQAAAVSRATASQAARAGSTTASGIEVRSDRSVTTCNNQMHGFEVTDACFATTSSSSGRAARSWLSATLSSTGMPRAE